MSELEKAQTAYQDALRVLAAAQDEEQVTRKLLGQRHDAVEEARRKTAEACRELLRVARGDIEEEGLFY